MATKPKDVFLARKAIEQKGRMGQKPVIDMPPKPGETLAEWAMRETVRMEMATNTVNNRIAARRAKSKLAKASRKRNR